MKIVQINQMDRVGGASIASYRLHEGLLSEGQDAYLLVGGVTVDDNRIDRFPAWTLPDKVLLQLTKQIGLYNINFITTFTAPGHPFWQQADILHFHNLAGYFNYLALPWLLRDKPAVLTLHDMWAFTGHCSYSYDCERWRIGCGHCPYPEIHPPMKRDGSWIEWRLKRMVYSQIHLTVVAPSRWLADVARQSMLRRFEIHTIPNGLDTAVYRPVDQAQAREHFHLDPERNVLMFAAMSTEDKRKGGDLLITALNSLPDEVKKRITLLVIGHGDPRFEQVGIETRNLGYVSDDEEKALAYSAADLFLMPTRADNLPIVLQESMACGTPMIAFDVGGVAELVRPGVTGYLAEAESVEDFRLGIQTLLASSGQRKKLSQHCRQIALSDYGLKLQVQRMLELYQHVIEQQSVSSAARNALNGN